MTSFANGRGKNQLFPIVTDSVPTALLGSTYGLGMINPTFQSWLLDDCLRLITSDYFSIFSMKINNALHGRFLKILVWSNLNPYHTIHTGAWPLMWLELGEHEVQQKFRPFTPSFFQPACLALEFHWLSVDSGKPRDHDRKAIGEMATAVRREVEGRKQTSDVKEKQKEHEQAVKKLKWSERPQKTVKSGATNSRHSRRSTRSGWKRRKKNARQQGTAGPKEATAITACRENGGNRGSLSAKQTNKAYLSRPVKHEKSEIDTGAA